jgi:hypothetical protein
VAAVVWGWGVARYPVLLPGTSVTLANAGAPEATLVALIVVFIAAVLLVGPAFVLLFVLHSRRLLGADDHGILSAAIAGPAPPGSRPAPQEQPGRAARAIALGLVAVAAVMRRRTRR